MRQARKRIKTLSLTSQGLRQYFACQVRVRHAMTATALGVIDVVTQAADLRQTRQGEEEIAGPGVVDLHVLQLRKGLEHFRSDDRFDIRRVPRAIDHAAAEDQALVAGEAVVVEQVVAVLDTVILWQ